jgi:hypothetical protein
MAVRKSFALRIDSRTLDAMQRWAKDDLRSLNAQIEFVMREALRQSGRLRASDATKDTDEQ